ncbi:MAG: hypothetical protein COT34_00845 [Candidatus Nealsonbacteria bacterium CG08_land_8_20_14_0_20_43_11]|uniref:Asparaginyl-tRNA synthetase n=1 Tax=Candidatus Nealsonbacteria bacterium CG08_land_8_20_14_0_20_43_11 TaxID=1974706 RepID=A0A2M6T171_9BACT|nr:MAG: hypothetical protein COT34_00845 [Candidatus Nealsonbacteria bacterium CG08_land_8_20_14_0_20_43_11]
MNTKVIKLTDFVLAAARRYLKANCYTEVVVPRVVRASGACENINTLFEVSFNNDLKWFNGKRAYLAQTGQLYLEALVPKLNNVYCVGPSFRAEPKADARHLTEFLMIEIEHPGGFDKLLKYIEGAVAAMAHSVAGYESTAEEFGLSADTLHRLSSCPDVFTKITYDEAIGTLQELGEAVGWGDDISSTQEKKLVEFYGNQPLFITRFPDPMYDFGKDVAVEKFFNMLPDKETPGRVLSADLILPFGGEAVGSAARVHQADVLVARLKNSRMFQRLVERGGGLEDFDWYINQVKANGAVPHAGCGFGMARIIQWLLGAETIQQAVTFPANRENLI